jgi:SecD/SecF fusion protein
MKPFFWRIAICLIPNLLAAWAVGVATQKYFAGEGGFKLGVDLAGGTILVYEIDASKLNKEFYDPNQKGNRPLSEYLKQRIDPNDLFNIVIRMVGDTRVEVILPTGGRYRTEKAREAWQKVIEKVKAEWEPRLKSTKDVFDVGQGKVTDLAENIKKRIDEEKWPVLLRPEKKDFLWFKVSADDKKDSEKEQSWAKLTKIARDWDVPQKDIDQIEPGDYTALIKRLQNYRRAVDEIRGTAQAEAWKNTLALLEKRLFENTNYGKDYKALAEAEGPDKTKKFKLDPTVFSPQDRDLLVNYIVAKGNPFSQAALSAVQPLTGPFPTPKTPSPDKIYDFLNENYGWSLDFISDSINKYYKASERRDVTTEEIQRIKELIARVGKLEFLILANNKDDERGAEAAEQYLKGLSKEELDKYQKQGKPPPTPKEVFQITTANNQVSDVSYSWVEIGWRYRKDLGLQNKNKGGYNWMLAERARQNNTVAKIPDQREGSRNGDLYVYSRECKDQNLSEEQRKEKQYDYFILARDPEIDRQGEFVEKGKLRSITGGYLNGAGRSADQTGRPCVNFQFNGTGSALFGDLTGKNVPGTGAGKFYRHLAIVLDGQVMSAPVLQSRIDSNGQITGQFTAQDVDQLVNILRSGALPATLKPQPVSENTMGATLGEDTIHDGVTAVGLAFIFVLGFMLVYYRFAGLVACIALLSNLLLTVGFMVAVQATFTLPGLAGLVLMLGMAVDANVLIYERLREERDRGASLALAIRNGYDRAFPTIIDTHLSSIFTAIVLYVVGNDQLKGFGVSLTVGLIISLFTSLYMTRLLFDIWQNRGWLKKLSMFRLLSRTNIDFMAIRYYWFTATILLTIIGATVFVVRGKQGLNIDFVGGTAYGGKLVQPVSLTELRDLLSEKRQAELLKVEPNGVKQKTEHFFTIKYVPLPGEKNPEPVDVYINQPEGNTPEERQANVMKRAQELPDLSVEQVFLTSDEKAGGDKSRYFTVRTVEKEVKLVQESLYRLLRTKKGESLLEQVKMKYDIPARAQEKRQFLWFDMDSNQPVKVTDATLTFTDPGGRKPEFASPSYVGTLLTEKLLGKEGTVSTDVKAAAAFTLSGEGKSEESRYSRMSLTLASGLARDEFETVLAETAKDFNKQPQPERLENFDSALAAETRGRAILAIVLSWGAILLYLWFRFGSWTFGLAAVVCLIHDLFFTLGMIAFASFLHGTAVGSWLGFQDFKLDLTAVAALLTLVGYSVNDTIVVFDRIREVRGKNPELTPQIINDSVNQTLSRTLLTAFSVWLVVSVLYIFGGPGVHLFAFVMVVGVVVGTYSSIYIASPLLLIFGEGARGKARARERQPKPVPAPVS